MMYTLTFAILALAIAGRISGYLTGQCAHCICMVGGQCTDPDHCADPNNICQISSAYYVDGSSPAGEGGYERCARDYGCSLQNIWNYMARYEKDCNGDGVIDCEDYLSIHMNGPWGCANPPSTLPLLQQCLYEPYRYISS